MTSKYQADVPTPDDISLHLSVMCKFQSGTQEYKNLSWLCGADRKSCPRVTVWHHKALPSDAKQWSRGIAPNNHYRLFFLHTFWSPVFDFNVGVAINDLCSYTLPSVILKVDVLCDVNSTQSAVTSYTTNVLTKVLLFIFYLSHVSDNVCKIRFVSTGESHWKLCWVCKKDLFCLWKDRWFPFEILFCPPIWLAQLRMSRRF